MAASQDAVALQIINQAFIGILLLVYRDHIQELEHAGPVTFAFRAFIPDVIKDGDQQHLRAVLPELVSSHFVISLRVCHDIVHQDTDILFLPQVGKGFR